MAQKKIPTWAAVLIAGVIILGMLAVAAVGGAVFFIHRHVDTTFTAYENAAAEFTTARARFAGQQPLIELIGEEPVLHRELVAGTRGRPIDSLRVLAYDRHARKLVRVTIPLWLLRLVPANHFSFLDDNGIDIDSDRVPLTLEDLERRGPGLVLDTKDRRGSEVVVWTE
jgi:type II secretory pathway pseudopilin PulG